MKRYLRVAADVVVEIFQSIFYWFISNLRTFATLLNIILPYLCLYVGQYCYNFRGRYGVGSEVFIPIIFAFIIHYLRSFANKIGKGSSIPKPVKRFTEVSDDGEVSIPQERLEELIIYMADLEDWMERKKLL